METHLEHVRQNAREGEYSAVKQSAPDVQYPYPAAVRFRYFDERGRRCTQFVCTCESAGRDCNADAELIAKLLSEHRDTSPATVSASPDSALIGDETCDYCEEATTLIRLCRGGRIATCKAHEHLNYSPRSGAEVSGVDDREIATMAALTVCRYFGRNWVNWTPETRLSEAERVILLAIQEAKASPAPSAPSSTEQKGT